MQHLVGLAFLAFAVPAFVFWFVTLRWGVHAGATAFIGLIGLALLARATASTQAEAAMGRGLEVMFIWMPVAAGAVIGFGVGWLHRRNQ